MNILKKLIPTILVCLGLLMPSLAQAQDVSLRFEPGVAVPLTGPQVKRFHPGADVAVKATLGLTSYLDVGPSLSVLVLPSKVAGVGAATAWGAGGYLRFKRPHDNKGSGWTAVSPWIDGDLQYIRTGELNRAGLAFAVGAAFPVTEARAVWIGPFARYLDIVQGNRVGFDNTDAHVMILGVSLEVGSTHRPKRVEPLPEPVVEPVKPAAPSDRDHDGTPDSTDKCPDVPGPKDNFGCPYPAKPAVAPQVLELKEKVQFPWNSAKLDSSAQSVLDEVVAQLLNANEGNKVTVEGHASSEGKVEYNNKLALKRASSVVEYLVSKGVKRERLTSKGFGSSVPIASNKTDAGRVLNRRVEFDVTFVIVKESK